MKAGRKFFRGVAAKRVVVPRFNIDEWSKPTMSSIVAMASLNHKKYKNAVIFFAKKIRNGTLGKLKLMKLLYYLDFDFFEKYGRSITGDEYLRFENGPVPRMGEKILKEMSGKEIKISKRKVAQGYNDQQHIEALIDFDVNVFEKEELIMLEEIASKWEKF